jgi:colanic acid/amylovoran biosynthesis glycosyltransferase
VAYYPKISHTFIRREIEAAREAGLRVEAISVRRPGDDEIRSEADSRESASTLYILDGNKGQILRAHAHLVSRHPKAYFAALAHALHTGPAQLRRRVWQLFYFAEAVQLVALMRAGGVRHVHVHFSNNAADIARLAVVIGSASEPDQRWSWSLTVHGPTEFSNVTGVDLAAKVHSASFVACISDFCRSQLMAIVEPSDWAKMHVVHMGVDVERYPPRADERATRTTDSLRVLFVGRLVPEKGVPLLLDVAERIAADRHVEFAIVGAGPLEASLATGIERRGLADRVRLIGAVGQDDLPEWYGWADVFCLPSFAEGLPVVLMEAMLSQLPVITTAIAGIPELVKDDDTGVLVPAGRIDLLVAAIERLADEPASRRRLGEAGRRAVERDFDAAVNGRLMADLLSGSPPQE